VLGKTGTALNVGLPLRKDLGGKKVQSLRTNKKITEISAPNSRFVQSHNIKHLKKKMQRTVDC